MVFVFWWSSFNIDVYIYVSSIVWYIRIVVADNKKI